MALNLNQTLSNILIDPPSRTEIDYIYMRAAASNLEPKRLERAREMIRDSRDAIERLKKYNTSLGACDCEDFKRYEKPCKHIMAMMMLVRIIQKRDADRSGSPEITDPIARDLSDINWDILWEEIQEWIGVRRFTDREIYRTNYRSVWLRRSGDNVYLDIEGVGEKLHLLEGGGGKPYRLTRYAWARFDDLVDRIAG